MRSALVRIGPPVLNGGVSTLVAILAVMASESHVFVALYKVREEIGSEMRKSFSVKNAQT